MYAIPLDIRFKYATENTKRIKPFWSEIILVAFKFVERVGSFNCGFKLSHIVEKMVNSNRKRFINLSRELNELLYTINTEPLVLKNSEATYKDFKKAVSMLIWVDSLFSKIRYFDDSVTEFYVKDCLQASYAIEAELKILAYKDKKRVTTPNELVEALSEKSKKNLFKK